MFCLPANKITGRSRVLGFELVVKQILLSAGVRSPCRERKLSFMPGIALLQCDFNRKVLFIP